LTYIVKLKYLHNMIIFTEKVVFKGSTYRLEICQNEEFNESDVTQVYCMLVNSNSQLAIVYTNDSKMWVLPGGGREKGESIMDTLRRELKEEANAIVYESTVKLSFIQKVYKIDEEGSSKFEGIQARYIASLYQADEFESDPDGDILEVKWISADEIDTYLDWGKTNDLIKHCLLDYNKSRIKTIDK